MLGAATVAGFAPLEIFPLPFVTLALLFMLWRGASTPRYAALIGFSWGLGFFLVGVSWVYVSLHDVGDMALPLAAAATLLFCTCLALFPAAVAYAFKKLSTNIPFIDASLLAGFWTAGEWLRGTGVAGFPWLSLGYSQVASSPLSGFAPIIGSYGVSFLLALIAGLLACNWWRARALLLIVVLIGAGALLRMVPWTTASGDGLTVSLLQGNIPQSLKWDPRRLGLSLDTYRQLSNQHPAQLIVLPETAIPLLFDEIPPEYLRTLAGHNALLMGAALKTGNDRYANAAVSLNFSGDNGIYAKSHLVPFGEYVPPGFAWFFNWVRIPMTNFESGQNQRPLMIQGHKIAANICYEDVFGEEIIRQLPEADILINLSNTAWFGRSLAQPQHLQMSRMRAIETGRPMLRSTNTGMTAAINPHGDVTSALLQFEQGALTVDVTGYSGTTPYVLMGNYAVLIIIALSLLPAVAQRRRMRSKL